MEEMTPKLYHEGQKIRQKKREEYFRQRKETWKRSRSIRCTSYENEMGQWVGKEVGEANKRTL